MKDHDMDNQPAKESSMERNAIRASLHQQENSNTHPPTIQQPFEGFFGQPVDNQSTSPLEERGHLSRSPRRQFEDEAYIHSATQFNRLRNRRQSDPGRVPSLSPLRQRIKVDRQILEDTGECGDMKLHPRLAALKGFSDVDPPMDVAFPEFLPDGTRPKGRTKRAYSLPALDPAILEIGEAVGALAVNDPAPSPEHHLAPPVSSLSVPRRRRSVSIESTSLEAIMEELPAPKAQNRRYSTPVMAAAATK